MSRLSEMTVEEWKAGVKTSSNIRPGEEVTFTENERYQCVSAYIVLDKARSVGLGYYMLDLKKGWWYE